MPERPDSPDLADAVARLATAYVHIPFCAVQCPYCDYCIVAGRRDAHGRYAAALVAEIETAAEFPRLGAVHFGGGTPTLLEPTLLGDVVAALGRRFGFTGDVQVAVEANPEDLDERRCRLLSSIGFNRVVVGAQSFDAQVLAVLGRKHLPADAARAVAAARRGGFPSIGLDLVFGAPLEDGASWEATLEAALQLHPDHVSVYELSVQQGTELWDRVRAGTPAPDPDDLAAKYRTAARVLEAAGLVRYEVSSWARPGHASLYALATWGAGSRLGFGLGATAVRNRRPTRNLADLDSYLETVEAGEPTSSETGADSAETTRLLLGLQRAAGVAAGKLGMALWESAAGRRLAAAGVLRLHQGRLIVADPLRTDAVGREVLAVNNGEC